MVPATVSNPDRDRIVAIVLDSVTSPESKRAYQHGIESYRKWHAAAGRKTFDKASVNGYKTHLKASGLSASTINGRLIPIRRLAAEAADNGLMPADVAAAIGRVRGAKSGGVRSGNWLSREQAENLLQAPGVSTLKGKRDTALLAVLIGCGLRRLEVAALMLESVQQRDGRWCVVDMRGKGNRIRTVAIPSWAKAAVDRWVSAAGFSSGRVFRPVNRGGNVAGDSMTAQSIYEVVKSYASDFAPHDLRRSFAKLAHRGHAPLEQIQISLGHASIQTTERYLGVRQDLANAPCDVLGLRLGT